MKTLKNAIGFTLFVVGISVGATVFAATTGVRFTVHNLSNNTDSTKGFDTTQKNFYSSNVDQVCIFCHTPHNAKPARPLWNKATLTAATTFKMYTSSATLSPTAKASSLTADSPSLLCLSCHDGKTAMNVLHNSKVGSDAQPFGYAAGDILVNAGTSAGVTRSIQYYAEGFGFKSTANIGGTEGSAASRAAGDNLTDDHPIGFNYFNAWNTSAATKAALHDVASVTASGKIKFFNGKLECSSCHDPHVAYDSSYGNASADETLRPFLVMSNVGSSLCLSCHNK